MTMNVIPKQYNINLDYIGSWIHVGETNILIILVHEYVVILE
jgi:hypothetical protein